jgi:SGNH hydrolase-like domain, acetyltransferase AlgX
MKTVSNTVLSVCFLAFVFGMGIFMEYTPDREQSYYENRVLATEPKMKLDKLADGSFVKEYESYFTDQFIERDEWIKMYLNWQKMTDQTYIYKYFITDDRWVFPQPVSEFSKGSFDKSIASMKEFNEYTAKKGVELFYFSLPDRKNVFDVPYPSYAAMNLTETNKDYVLSRFPQEPMHVVDLSKPFREKFDQEQLKDLYFVSDHHWNMSGAYEGYKLIRESLAKQSEHYTDGVIDEKQYKKTCYDHKKFMGGYNKQLYGMIDLDREKICHIESNEYDLSTFELYLGPVAKETKTTWDKIYGKGLSAEGELVDYGTVFTGDMREFNVINPAKKEEGKRLLILKDSYANPLTQLMSQHYYQTTFYDIRYNQDRSVVDYMEKHDFDTVVILYNNGTLFSTMYDFDLSDKKEREEQEKKDKKKDDEVVY